MVKFIVDNNFLENVYFVGFGNFKEVFKDVWLFMNLLILEGLLFVIGEVVLVGVFIVVMEVGVMVFVLIDFKD